MLALCRGAERTEVRIAGRLRFANAHACAAAAVAGFRIAAVPAFVAADDLRAGRLRPLLCDFEPDPVVIHVVYPTARHLAAKVRAFVDFLVKRFAGGAPWHRGW